MDPDDLICPMIASYLALLFACGFILAIHFILDISGVLLFIIIGLLSFCLLAISIMTTISYLCKNIVFYKIVRYIALGLILILVLFFFGFLIWALIYFFMHLSEIKFFSSAFKLIGVMVPLGLLISMLLNVIHPVDAEDSKEGNGDDGKEELKNGNDDENSKEEKDE